MSGDDRIFATLFAQALTAQQVHTRWLPEPPSLPSAMQRQIEAYWESLPKDFIYNGALARLAGWRLQDGTATFTLQMSDYRTLLFSNRYVEQIRRNWGDACLSRALGISALLKSADGRLLFIERSTAVGEFPGALDVFGGHIDPPATGTPDVFAAMAKELQEEAGLRRSDYDLMLIGMIESTPNRKPELIFCAETHLTEQEMTMRANGACDRNEFAGIFSIADQDEPLRRWLHNEKERWSPSAYGGLSLYMSRSRKQEGKAHES